MTVDEHIAAIKKVLEDCRGLPGESPPSRTHALINLVKLKEFISSAQACGHDIQVFRFNSIEAISFHCVPCERQTSIDVDMADLNQTGTKHDGVDMAELNQTGTRHDGVDMAELNQTGTRHDGVDMADLNQTGTRQKRKRRMSKDRSKPMEAYCSDLPQNLVRSVTGVVGTDINPGFADEVTGISAGGTSSGSGLDRDVGSTSGFVEDSFEVRLSLRELKEAIESALSCEHNLQELRESDGLSFYCFCCKRRTAIHGTS